MAWATGNRLVAFVRAVPWGKVEYFRCRMVARPMDWPGRSINAPTWMASARTHAPVLVRPVDGDTVYSYTGSTL